MYTEDTTTRGSSESWLLHLGIEHKICSGERIILSAWKTHEPKTFTDWKVASLRNECALSELPTFEPMIEGSGRNGLWILLVYFLWEAAPAEKVQSRSITMTPIWIIIGKGTGCNIRPVFWVHISPPYLVRCLCKCRYPQVNCAKALKVFVLRWLWEMTMFQLWSPVSQVWQQALYGIFDERYNVYVFREFSCLSLLR